jgi:hypothetical protein
MTMTVREAFERGTETFNAHDLDGFAEVLADDVVFEALGKSGEHARRPPRQTQSRSSPDQQSMVASS